MRLAAFLSALHHPAPPDAPTNPVRGVPLATRAEPVAERLARLAAKTNLVTPRVRRVWRDALDAPLAKVSCWFHRDLHPLNVLVRHQRIAGVIDWGDVGGGDVATDLAAFWMLFHGRARRRALAAYASVDEATIARARGWAVSFGTMLLDAGLVDDHRQAVAGATILKRVVDDP